MKRSIHLYDPNLHNPSPLSLTKIKVKPMWPKILLRVFLLTALLLAASFSSVYAYETYSSNGSTGNCASCHGNFRASPYVSLADGANWGDDLHDIHRNVMLNGDCNACHSSDSKSPVLTDSSAGSNGFNISCNGCHGRSESAASGQVLGVGLRQHHWNAGTTSCINCHSDSNPSSFLTVGENVPPPYYFLPDASHPNKPTDPCNPNGEENYAGTAIGLDNNGDGIYDLSDSNCQAPAPDINFNPASLGFGSLIIGNSNLLNTQVENLGSADLVVSNIARGAGTSTEFTFTTLGTPFTITPGNTQAISVTYLPTNAGTDNGSLVISSNDPDEPTFSLSLSGTGEPPPAPDINLNPASLTLGSSLIGNPLSQNTAIQNLGTAALIITGISPAAGTSNEFSFTAPGTPFTIIGGGSQTVTVTYLPIDAGTDNGSLIITSNDSDEPTVSLSISGTGDTTPTPDIDISPTALNFNSVNIGGKSTRMVTVQNLGTASLTTNTIGLCIGTSTEFSWLPNAPFTLQPKTLMTLSVSYTPLDTGVDTGCLTLSSNDPDEPTVEIGLQAAGIIYKSSVLNFMPAILAPSHRDKP
jgi:hypothetical protein